MFVEVWSTDNRASVAARSGVEAIEVGNHSGLECDHLVDEYHLVHFLEVPLKNNLEFSETLPWIHRRK